MSFSSPYQSAGWLLNEHIEKRRGLKSIAFEKGGKNKTPDKATYATVCKTMQHLTTIKGVLNANNKKLRKAIEFDSVRSKGLLYVMLHELLFGKYKKIIGGGKIKRLIVKHEKELRQEAEIYIQKNGGAGGAGSDVNFPRYIRVNTLRSSADEIVNKLKEDLSAKITEEANSAKKNNDQNNSMMYVDAHVPDLLVLPPTASSWLHRDYEPVKSGKVVLQDKSSCFSALVLTKGLGEIAEDDDDDDNKASDSFDYIDACSAPGNKTSHLAALAHSIIDDGATNNNEQPKKKKKGKAQQKPKSTIFAFERASARFTILEERMELLVPSDKGSKVAVEPIHGDFLKSDPADPKFANVRGVTLDPSCSGSGIVNSPDRWMEEGDGAKDTKRIQSLSNFQLVALKHAMSFPQVDRIVYSTCSVHEEENEAVVSKALSEVENTDDGNEWVLMAPVCLEHWTRRGKEGGIGGLTKDQADCLIRCDGLDGDETNGFFVSFFVRKKLTDGLKKSRKVIDENSAGIPVYDGQFVPAIVKTEVTTTATSSPEKVNPKQTSEQAPLPPKSGKKQQTQTKKDKTTKSAGKSAKKIEKKLAWKRNQALLKGQRMKKKEEGSKAKGQGMKKKEKGSKGKGKTQEEASKVNSYLAPE